MCNALYAKVASLKCTRHSIRVARFLAAKYGRLLSIPDVRQGQYDAISCVCVCSDL